MTIAPAKHGAPSTDLDPAELLISEARQKARRRRLQLASVILTVFVVAAAILVAIGRVPTSSAPMAARGTDKSVGANSASIAVANLAGVNTMIASGSRVWVSIDRESLTNNHFAVIELNANNGSLIRVIRDRSGSVSEPGLKKKVGDLAEPGPLAVSGSHLWVGDDRYWNIAEFNANNGSLIRVINAKADQFADPGAIAVSEGHVWVANSQDGANSVTELNASNGSLERVINAKAYQFNEPSALAVSDNRVWVLNANGDSITELNASNGSLVRVINARAGCCAARSGTFESAGPIALAVSGSHLWVTDLHDYANGGTSHGSLVELNASNGSLVRVIGAKAYELNIPRVIAVSGGHAWVQDDGNKLTELNASNGSLVRVINVKLNPRGSNSADGLAASGSHVLVLNIYSGQEGSVTVLNAKSGTKIRVIK